jgi:hypothetical protein
MDINPIPNPAPQEPLSPTLQPTPPVSNFSSPVSPSITPAPINPAITPTPSPAMPTPPPTGIIVDGSFMPESTNAPAFQPQMSDPSMASTGVAGSKTRLPKAILIAVTAVTVLGFSSAAAYFGVVVPNQPANQLKKALLNTVQEKQASFKGTITADAAEDGLAGKVDMDGKYNSDKKAAALTTAITVSGVKLNVETRYVDNSIYLKTSDLNTIATLAAGFSPETGDLIKSVSGTISNKWIEIDSTLLNQAGASCVLDSKWTFTDKDIDLLTNQYQKHQFVTIKGTSSEAVNGLAATKFNLAIDNKQASQYADGLNDLSMLKSLQKCAAGKDLSNQTADSVSSGTTDLTIWVDKATKHVAQIGYDTPSQQAAKDGTKSSFRMSFDYKPVSIDKPANATPVMDVFAKLQTQLGSSGLDLTSLFTGVNGKAEDNTRQANIGALQTQLEVFYQNNGYYPSLADMNNATWLKANMKELDPAILQDPVGSSSPLAGAPAPNVYAYQPADAAGKSCEADHTTCAAYKLTATLTDGTAYVKENLD